MLTAVSKSMSSQLHPDRRRTKRTKSQAALPKPRAAPGESLSECPRRAPVHCVVLEHLSSVVGGPTWSECDSVNRETRSVELVLHDTDTAHNSALTILCCRLWATRVLIKFLESSMLLIPVACVVPLCSLAGVGHTNSECHPPPS